MDGENCLIAELAKRNIPEGITNILEGEESFDPDEFHAVYIYPNTYVAMSFEAREALIGKMKEPAKENAFLADFIMELSDYDKRLGSFGFLPGNDAGESQRKKIAKLSRRFYMNSFMASLKILDTVQILDNEILKNLDLTEPVDEDSIR